MALKINQRYADRPLTIVAVMTGSLVLLADLIRRLRMPIRVSLIQASSYRGGTESGELWLRDDMMLDVTDRHVLVLDDIFDTGKTLQAVLDCVSGMRPSSLASTYCCKRRDANWSRCVPISWPSESRTNLSWATDWIIRIFTAICLTWRCWKTVRFQRKRCNGVHGPN